MSPPSPGPVQRILNLLRASAVRRREPGVELELDLDVLGVGECSRDQVLMLPPGMPAGALSQPGAKISASSLTVLGGGQIATALCAARRLGRSAALCGAVGGDVAGQAVLDELDAEGVDVRWVHRAAEAQTRTAVVLVQPDGERVVVERRDPALVLPPDYPSERMVASARVVHVDGTYPEASLRAARLARDQDALVSLDLDLAGPGSAELVALADVCAVSASFPTALTGEPDLEAATRALARSTPGLVIVTLGGRGCLAAPRTAGTDESIELVHVPAFVPPALIDTTACGDTFHAALLAWLLDCADRPAERGADASTDRDDRAELLALLRFASAAAALKCGALGRSGCPTRVAVDEFLSPDRR